MTPELISLIILVAGFIASLAKLFWPLISAKLGATNLETLNSLIKIAIFAAEQIFTQAGKGMEKKEFVINFIQKKFPKMSREEIEVLIEGIGKEFGIFKQEWE